MNTEEVELLQDSKYRSYINAVDKALKSFEYSSEWADLISALGKLNKVLQNHSKYQVIPKKMIIGKRLAQCLHPALPSGVHLKALETYEIIFRTIGSKRLARDLFLYSSGLFPLLANAAMSAKPALLQLYENYYLALGRTLRPGLQGFLIGILPGLEEGSEYYDRTNSLLEKTCAAVEASVFHGALWASVLTSPSVRLPAMTYALSHLNRRQSMEDQLHVIGTDIELMVEAVCVCVQDSSVLVQRSTLDLLLFCFPFYHTQVVKMDMVHILSSALHVVLRRDMSLNRRLYAWLLGCDNNGTHVGPRSPCATTSEERGSHYFNTYSRDFLVQAMISILKWRGTSEEDGTGVQPNLKPFRILLCLLDKPEIGPAILEDVLIEVFRALHTRCECEIRIRTSPAFSKDSSGLSSKIREDRKTAEVVKTANLLFSSFEPYYIWDYISRQFQDCCRMSGKGAGRVRRESGLSEQELTVCELCVLTDFLLDIVSLESYIEIQTGHLPRLLLLLVTCMSRYMDSLSLVELSDMLRLCSKILSRVQPPLVPTLVPHSDVEAVSMITAPSIAVGTKGEVPASSTSQNISIFALAAATLPETEFSNFDQCRSHWPTGHGTGVACEEVVDSLVQHEQQERGRVTQNSESNVRDFQIGKDSMNCGSDSIQSSTESRNKEMLDLSGRKNGETEVEEKEKNRENNEDEEEKMEETKGKEGMMEEGWEALAHFNETGKTTMQLCVELFQGFYTQFLCRHVLGNEFAVTNFVRDIAIGGSTNDGLGSCELWKKADGTAMLPGMKECRKRSQDTDNHVGALTAASQLFLECSSFPVYVAEGSPSSPRHEASSCTEQFPDAVPMWLQSLLACCCLPCHFGPDPFPTQAVAIGCFLDLLNLTHSVSRSTGRVGEGGGTNSPEMSECSPSHGRVAVLIVPPLTQLHVGVIARDTLFFQRVAEILWVHLAHEVPKHQLCAVDLLQQLHGLASGPAVCEDVISRDLASHITALRVEAHKKFSVLWHLTRDVQRGKATAFTRTFDRSLLLMLESLWTARDNASRSVALSWLRQVIQRHDIPRILEPLLLLLLHPKTQRVALSYAIRRIQPKTSVVIEVGEPGLDKVVTDKWGRYSSERDGDESTTEMRICVHASTEQGGAVVSEGVRMDATLPPMSVSLRVNPLGGSQSPQSSCESLNEDQENEQLRSTVSNHLGVPSAFQREEEEVGHVLKVLVDEVSRGIEDERVSARSSGEENVEENDEPEEEEEEESEDCERECSLTSSECEPSSTASSPERHYGNVEEGEPWQGNVLHGLIRPSSLPDLYVHKGSDVVCTSLTPDGTGESAEAWKEGLVDKLKPIVGSHKSTGAVDTSPGSGANSAWQVPLSYGGDAASLEAWYIPGEAEGGESFIDDEDEKIEDEDVVDRNKESMNGENHRVPISVTRLIEQSKGHTFPMVHPLYQHVLLYLQPYDAGRVLHVLTALRAMLFAYPSTFVSAISTTGMSGGSSPRLSWLQDLLTRHHAALSGRDFYTITPGPAVAQSAGSVGFRSAMYLEVILSLCLAFLRSHYPSQARASSQDVADNRDVQVLSAELLTIIISTLARIVETGVGSALVPGGGSVSGSGYASFLVDLLARCKMQRVLLHCLLAGVAVPHLRHKLCAGIITSSKIQVKENEEESPGDSRPVDIFIDESADASGLQAQLLELLQVCLFMT
uniref:protein dopey-1-like n=1 Tax=Myxine glutinosa TaxID=7769 RepID=UPI00358F4F3A